MDQPARNPLRFLAPIALIAAALLFLVVIAGAIGGGEEDSASTAPTGQAERGGGGGGSGGGSDRNAPETYEIQEGDTLDSISADTGVSVEEIQELNPDLDPQSLIAGQELQISE